MKIPQKKCPHCSGSGKSQDESALGLMLKQIRENKRLTLREMANRLNLSIGYISDLEHGRKAWSGARIQEYLIAAGQK